ncbi:hypothetical protein ABB37_02926 [Leptomonas pyrrhocoris]|uniref:Uncharacterized protein n=1 Tax=Leptomonas pyrrhocoris TaxID=157538 RepID=A0A0M9G699_LEPPY|nr:hypothetical protein ABB37_02926 [Leptomonas pyrrhocoris]KPA83247.1 hypothetical protein ABB37_02926 [Leptomonas pyrrhocoris]|eukprot:XP_015661686.1 hypothetical protein ABB37_02926 [Leptomonas pyrrhocoris]
MKFTHREIEEDRKKPVGSLFMHLIDRDSMPSRAHYNQKARMLDAHSLPDTQLCLYVRDTPMRAATPLHGRRHFAKNGQHTDCARTDYVRPPSGVRRCASANGGIDHIEWNMTPRPSNRVPTPRQKRYVPPPSHESSSRPFWLGSDDAEGSSRRGRGAARSSSVSGSVYSRNSSSHDHLAVGSLLPFPEKPVERPVPPPLPPRKRRTTGIRMFPEQRSRSMDDTHRGVRMMAPQPHWRSAADRQWDFLELGVARRETPAPLYRNHSTIDVGGGPIIVSAEPEPQEPRWRGGRRGCVTPMPRSYDIITGRPLVH